MSWESISQRVGIAADDDDDDAGFWTTQNLFSTVDSMQLHNIELHSLALFLHPMCRKLTVTDASKGRPFEFMVKTALAVAKRWRWGEQKAKLLVDDLKACPSTIGKSRYI